MMLNKFKIEISDKYEVLMPKGAALLCVQVQGGEVFVWADVDTDRLMERRTFYVFGTGNPIPVDPADREYVGTVQLHGDVWHVFTRV